MVVLTVLVDQVVGNGPGSPSGGVGDFPGSSGTQSAGISVIDGGDAWNNGSNLVNGGAGSIIWNRNSVDGI